MSVKVEVSGFENREQAELFIAWFEGSGEGGFGYWTEERFPDFNQYTDLKKTYPLVWEDDTVKLVLKGSE